MREVIQGNSLSAEELLHKMQLRIWDDPLNQNDFNRAIRKVDPTLTDVQLHTMANEMKDTSNKVPIQMILQNLVGNEYETSDFRNRMFKRIYAELSDRKNEDKLKRAFYKYDKKNDGSLNCRDMFEALTLVLTTLDENSIEKFIKFLDKDENGRISYTQFLTSMNDTSNRNHNPFQ